jgi:dihydropteroate synthase
MSPHPARGFTAAGRWFACPGDRTYVMGVVNVSPESRVRHSFADSPRAALDLARRHRDAGAAIVDLGAQSSHFENPELSEHEELSRLLPALELLVADGFVVSVDTWKPAVAAAAVAAGAAIVNDTGGLQDDDMVAVVAAAGVPSVAMYIRGRNPLAVNEMTFSDDKAVEVASILGRRITDLEARGVGDLLVDPGLSINYRSDYEAYSRQQLAVIRSIDVLRDLGRPVLIPVPRKAQTQRMVAYLTMSIEYGADVIRAHDVEAACDLVRLWGRHAEPVQA